MTSSSTAQFCSQQRRQAAQAPAVTLRMASNSSVRGTNKRDSRSKTGAGGRRKALLPDKVFLSDPEATALIRNKLTPVYFGGWAAKQGTDYYTYWYVCVEGKWTASSGADVPHLSCVYRKDIGTKWKLHMPEPPAWSRFVPDHF